MKDILVGALMLGLVIGAAWLLYLHVRFMIACAKVPFLIERIANSVDRIEIAARVAAQETRPAPPIPLERPQHSRPLASQVARGI